MTIYPEVMKVRVTAKMKKRAVKMATKMAMTPSAFIRWCMEQMLDGAIWDKQIANDVKSGKMKKLYQREGL